MASNDLSASPASVDLEESVLGSCLLDVRNMDTALSVGVGPRAFVTPGHQAIWRAAEQWHAAATNKREMADTMLLWEQIRANGQEHLLSGFCYIVTLISRAPISTYQHRDRCQALLQWQRRRQAWEAAHKIQQMAPDPTSSFGDMADVLEAAMTDLQGEQGQVSSSTAEACKALGGYLQAQADATGPLGLRTGFWELDNLTDGLEPGDHFVLAARPSEGKSALAWQIAEQVAAEAGPVGYFSMEMSGRSLMLRALSRRLHIGSRDLARGRLPAPQQGKLQAAMEHLASLPIHLDTRGSLTPSQLRACCRSLHRSAPLRLIVIDYLQLLQVRAASREQEVAQASRHLKALAMELGVPVLSCCQMSRANEYRSGKERRPRLSDLRDSGQIEQDADLVAFLYHGYRHGDGLDGQVEVVVAKHRDGPTGSVMLSWIPQFAAFADAIPLRVWNSA